MTMPSVAMVLAAGLGKRMRPITEHTPKPLIEIAGRTMLDRALDHLERAGVPRAVVNVHHLADRIRRHLQDRRIPSIEISDETDLLLETGGGVRRALPVLGNEPFFVINADIVWLDGARPALRRLAEAWDPARMDALLLLTPSAEANGYSGVGDFFLSADRRVRRRREKEVAPFVFAGVQIVKPELYADTPDGPFSNNMVFDRALADGRLFGLPHDGAWFHVGDPPAIATTERLIRAAQQGKEDDLAQES